METTSFTATALAGIPLIHSGDNLVALICQALEQNAIAPQDGDILVIASKIVSKSEGRYVNLGDVTPSQRALALAEQTGKDPRIVELVLQESRNVSRVARGVLVTEHRLGFVSANAGIDQSNVEYGEEQVLLLPLDPDQSARKLRSGLREVYNKDIGVVISDTHGRPFRLGNVGVAIGVAGLPALLDLRGQPDLFGRTMQISLLGYADLIASAAHLLSGEADEGRPVIHIRGLRVSSFEGRATDLYRPPEQDLYR